jgi:beta-lactam-binding protein with PASTA domain
MSYDEARQHLAHDGLQTGSIVTEPPGQKLPIDGSWRVVGQDPAAGDSVEFGTHVDLTLEDSAAAPC